MSIIFLVMAFSASADDKILLYKNFYYGMSSEEVFKTGPAQCDEYPDGQMICNRQKVIFADLQWTQFFEFKKDNLISVAFGHAAGMAAIDAALAWLDDNGYVPINAEAGEKSVNYTLLYDKSRRDEFNKEAEDFNRILPSADYITSYLLKYSSLYEFGKTGTMPKDAILVILEGSKKDGTVFICFEPAKNSTFSQLR